MEVTLTGEQISALDRRFDEFRAANHQAKEKIVYTFVRSFKGTLSNEEFNSSGVKTVCASFLTLSCSQIFPAYSAAPLLKNQIGGKTICSTKA